MNNYIIVAGGLNIRYQELSIFPKILLPVDSENSILTSILKNLNGKIYLIINERFFDVVNNYIEINNLNVVLIKSSNINGSYNTIASVVENLPNNGTFIWSDLIINSKTSFNDDKNSNIIYTKFGDYRFEVKNNKIKNVGKNGNIPGIYYIRDIKSFFSIKSETLDLVEVIDNFETIELKKNSILELRDKEIYLNYLSSLTENTRITRSFNTIDVQDDKIIKRIVNKKYEHLIKKEIGWYELISKSSLSGFAPKLIDKNSNYFVLENLKNHLTLYEYTKKTKNSNAIFNALNLVSKYSEVDKISVNHETVIQDLKIEFFEKTFNRINSIDSILYEKYDKFEALIERSFKELCKIYDNVKDYNFIHGDMNGSNVMCDLSGENIKLIDPRGYFGNTKFYGLQDYDRSKIAYFVSGYDQFNINSNFIFCPNYRIDYPKKMELNTDLSFPAHIDLIVGLIYINLASYIANNIFKANITYWHGIDLTKRALRRLKHEMF